MTKKTKQTRRCVSMRGDTYYRLGRLSEKTKLPCSEIVEQALGHIFENEELLTGKLCPANLSDLPLNSIPRPAAKTAAQVEKTSQETEILAEREVSKSTLSGLYPGRKPDELDPDTAAHRKAATIFTF